MSPQLGTFGAWFNPSYDDDTRVRFVAEAEALGFGTAWLGLGRRMLPDLRLVERALNATTMIVVATAIVNMWTNDAASIAESYERIDAKHPGRFLLGVGIGHPESINRYHSPYDTMVFYLDELDAAVPVGRRVLAARGDRALHLARDRAAGTHPYLVVPDHTHHAFLAASSAQLGNRTASGAHSREVLQREPAFAAQAFVGALHYRNPSDGEHVREGLLKAGLPD